MVVAEAVALDPANASTPNFGRWHFILAAALVGSGLETVKFAENACKRLTSTLGGHKITQAILGQLCHLLWHSNSQVLGCNDSGAGGGGDIPASGYIVRSPSVVRAVAWLTSCAKFDIGEAREGKKCLPRPATNAIPFY